MLHKNPHHEAEFVTVSDERDGDSLRHFLGILQGPAPNEGETAWVAWWCTDNDNGFGKPVGAQLDQFKRLRDNLYGA